MERTNLKLFRTKQKLSQGEVAELVGCSRATYSSIESGTRNGNHSFWLSFQKAFSIPDSELWGLMKRDNE